MFTDLGVHIADVSVENFFLLAYVDFKDYL